MNHDPHDGPDVITLPPLIFLAGLGLSIVGRMIRRLPILPTWLAGPRRKAGIWLIIGGFATAFWSARTFKQADTTINPHEQASVLVDSGPFEYSRNPIYVGASAVFSGISLLLNNLWGFLILPGVLAVVQRGVIEREEAHLRARFGEAYEAYTERVPRWF